MNIFERQTPGEALTLEELKECLEREDEQRRVEDAKQMNRGPSAEKAKLRAWVMEGEPRRSFALSHHYRALKKKHPDAYWEAVMECDREIYAERKTEERNTDTRRR